MASRGVNKVILVGNLGNDPESRFLPSGGAVTNITVATSETWKDKQTGQPQERTEWHRVVFFNRLAEIVNEYLRKGSKVYLEGSLRTRKWQDKQSGQDRYTTEIVASEMQMLDSRGASQSGGGYQPQGDYDQGGRQSGGQQSGGQQPGGQQSGGQQPGGPQGVPSGGGSSGTAPATDFGDFNDDIPF